ncbi:MAG: hypothetical protein M3O74_13725 [Pseudomonadota bacterium]|nr:hypothetical protein [Pseudomonadota bacterium]
MSMLGNVIKYARDEMPAEFADLEWTVRPADQVNVVAEIMRRINYNPDPKDLYDARARWSGMFSKPIADPKQARRAYRNFANDMNEDMVKSFQTALERRHAGLPAQTWTAGASPELPPAKSLADVPLTVEESFSSAPDAEDQTLDAVVDRLLSEAGPTSKEWGSW